MDAPTRRKFGRGFKEPDPRNWIHWFGNIANNLPGVVKTGIGGGDLDRAAPGFQLRPSLGLSRRVMEQEKHTLARLDRTDS